MPACFCGNVGCIERFLCGPALAESCDGPGHHDASGLPARAEAGDPRAKDALDKHVERLSRALAQLVTILDPDAIVFGGGLSNMKHLYTQLPPLIARHVVSPSFVTRCLPTCTATVPASAAPPGSGLLRTDDRVLARRGQHALTRRGQHALARRGQHALTRRAQLVIA